MKPVSVRLKAFGPYVDEQFVDFAQLEKGGLFLIAGDTGSGKTTILDAMCCALYGESSGGNRGSLEAMRCKAAAKEENTLVEFTFDHNGNRYRFVRELKFARKNMHDYHACMIERDGLFVPLLENSTKSAVNRTAEDIIGLTVGQFRQVIILPQGKFETLLTSDSVAKEAILTSIFDAEKWDTIAASLSAQVRQRDTALKAEAASLDALFTRYGCDGEDTMAALLAEKTAALEERRKVLAQAETVYAAMQKKLEELIVIDGQFAEWERCRKRYEILLKDSAAFAAEEAVLALADEAQKCRPLFDRFAAARQENAAAIKAHSEVAAVVETTAQQQQAAAKAVDAHEETASSVEEMAREAVVLREKRTVYEQLPQKRAEVQSASEQHEHAMAMLENAVKEAAVKEEAWQRCRIEQAEAIAACEAAEERYFRGIGGTLAAALEAGKPCPVCGSKEHPAPAVMTTDSISEEEFKTYKEARSRAIAAFDEAQRSALEAREHCQAMELRERQAAEQSKTATLAWETALSMRVEGIDTAAQLEARLQTCEQAQETFAAQREALQQALADATREAQHAAARFSQKEEYATATKQALDEAQTVWEEALAASPFADEAAFVKAVLPFEEREQRKTALGDAKAALAHAAEEAALWRERVGDKERPQMDVQKEQHRQAETNLEALRREITLMQNTVETLKADTEDAAKRMAAYREARQTTDADMEFSRRISGSSGVSLKRYVLGVMLTNITVQANQLLAGVYGGRYRLYRTDEIAGSGHKGGLELEVFDQYNNERRSVTTLSGGEKFLVALSLAIGLSAVVQAGGNGVRLEAMFVDEGFGSLSREAVSDAIEILQGVQKSNGLVGVISHVDKLAETIPNRIEITKTAKGSRLKVIVN